MVSRAATRTLLSLAAVLLLALALPAVASAATECLRTPGPGAPAPAISPPIRLIPDDDNVSINFGSGRGTLDQEIVVNLSRPLPARLRPDQITIDIPRRFRRVGETLQTVRGITPRFGIPNLRDGFISFDVCVDGEGIAAGSYSGLIAIGGPRGLERTAVTLTITAKDGKGFLMAAIVVLLLTFGFLLLKEQWSDKETYARWIEQADNARAAHPRRAFFLTRGVKFGLDGILIDCIVPVVLAFGAMFTAYNNDATWGAEGFASMLALITTAFASAGIRSLFTAFRR